MFESLTISFLLTAFIGGVFMFLAPCTLPLVPGYLAFIGGVNKKELENKETEKIAKRKIFKGAIFFAIGFSLIFILFGVLAGLFGRELFIIENFITAIGGVLIIFFGLFMIGIFQIPFLNKTKKISMPRWLSPGTARSSFIVGVIFAIGWTPCVGPILASILLLATTTQTIFSGAFLLAIFSLGLTLPFLLIALFYSKSIVFISKISKGTKVISIIGGVFFVIIGILILTDNFTILLDWGFKIFEAINYKGTENIEILLM